MSHLFAGISEILLALAIVDIIIVCTLSFIILQTFRKSLTSVVEKSAGPVLFYNNRIKALFTMDFSRINVLSCIHLIALHLCVPLLGLGLLLYTDWNFIALVAGIIWSYQLTNRFIPGQSEESN